MSLVSLYNVPSTQAELANWSFAHARHHDTITARIFDLYNVQLPTYILDPLNTRDVANWAEQHQQLHWRMDEVLGIGGYNLLGVDWKDDDQVASWIYLNAQEHREAAAALQLE